MPEVRRLLLTLVEAPERFFFRLAWSRFRRRHQAVARRCRAAHRASSSGSTSGPISGGPTSLPVPPDFADHDWERVAPLLPPPYAGIGRPPHDHRRMLEGMLWVMRRGASWRELPERFGKWEAVYRRYQKRRREGIWGRVLAVLEADAVL